MKELKELCEEYMNALYKKVYERAVISAFLDSMVKRMEETEDFIIGMDEEGNITHSHRDNNVFLVVRDKEDGRYYYNLLSEDVYTFNKAYKLFKTYVHTQCVYPYAGKDDYRINVEDIYDVDSLTSAKTLWELFARMEFTYRALNHLI